jgi:hypothetical protein
MTFLSAWKRRRAVKDLERQLGQRLSPDALLKAMMDGSKAARDRALPNFVAKDPRCSVVLQEFGLGAPDVENLHAELKRSGVGQWVRGRWVPVYVLTTPQLLRRAIRGVLLCEDEKERRSNAIRFVVELEDGTI